MPPIPHNLAAALSEYAAPLAAVAVAVAASLAGRGKSWAEAAGALGLFAGWVLLRPVALLPRVIWAPHRGVETLTGAALACAAGAALIAWRGGRQARIVRVLLAGFAGWWVARAGVGTADFWRVWFAIAALTWVVGRVAGGRADRFLVLGFALWGGLAVAGMSAGWTMAAAAVAVAAAGLVVAGAKTALPEAAIAALLGAADLAGGRLLRGRLDAVDIACLAALGAPLVSGAMAAWCGRASDRVAPILAAAAGAAAMIAVVWVLRRAFLT